MVKTFDNIKNWLRSKRRTWLVTGVAGFIGSNLLEMLLNLDQNVIGLDNFSTGKVSNLKEIEALVTSEQWSRFDFVQGDITHMDTCLKVTRGVDYILHQAALGSVPRSVDNPQKTNEVNVNGTLNIFTAAHKNKVKRVVYASSSSVYGDYPDLPKIEDRIGRPLSPYAVSKHTNELYAEVFAKIYSMELVGLRYFNVFGPRQDPEGAYAAVIPRWIAKLLKHEPIEIYGTGETSRDFCYVENVVQANLLAATTSQKNAVNQIYNVAVSAHTSLNDLFALLRDFLVVTFPEIRGAKAVYRDFRVGDVMHSYADINKARAFLGYDPEYDIQKGLKKALDWYVASLSRQAQK